MDGCISSLWLPFQSGVVGDGGGAGGAASELSCCSELELELQQEQDPPIPTQVKEQLQQIYWLMEMEEHEHAEAPSSQSSTFGSFSGSPGGASSTTLMPGSSSTSNSCHHTAPEVSSLNTPLSAATYGGDGHYGHCYYGMVPNLEGFTWQEDHAHQEQERAQRKANNGHGGASAFTTYSRHLSPKKKPKPGSAGGQRAIKAAISALERMHMVRLAQLQRRQMEMAVAPPPTAGRNCGEQLQHVLSERRRREKLNDSFKALMTVLPPAPKKDKASILMRARDYVNTLKSRVSELEERNRMLELQRRCNNGGDQEIVSGENIEADIDRAAAAAEETSLEFHLKVAVRPGCSAMDAVVGVLECLKEIGDVRLAAMDTDSRATTLTLQMKISRPDDNFSDPSVDMVSDPSVDLVSDRTLPF